MDGIGLGDRDDGANAPQFAGAGSVASLFGVGFALPGAIFLFEWVGGAGVDLGAIGAGAIGALALGGIVLCHGARGGVSRLVYAAESKHNGVAQPPHFAVQCVCPQPRQNPGARLGETRTT